jgi:hypothetical protein
MGKDVPLHKRVHFRRIKEIFREIGDYEGFNLSSYNLDNMKVFETVGENLKGKNVSYNIDGNSSCWVKDNRYEIYEAPSIYNQQNSPHGEFLFLAYNKSFDYYLFGYMEVKLDEYASRRDKFLVEKVYYKNHGKFTIVFQRGENNITKLEYGSKFDPGVSSSEHNFTFDSYNSRKMAYRTNTYKILQSIGVSGLDSHKITGDSAVKIYNKNKSNNRQGNKPNKPHNNSYNKNKGSSGSKRFGKPNGSNKRYH